MRMMLEELLDELACLESLPKDHPREESLTTEIASTKESIIAEFFKIRHNHAVFYRKCRG